MVKLNLTQQKHAFTNQKKCTTTQNKHKKLKPALVASYDIRPGNREGIFLFQHFINLSLTYLLRHLPTYLQPWDPHRASTMRNSEVIRHTGSKHTRNTRWDCTRNTCKVLLSWEDACRPSGWRNQWDIQSMFIRKWSSKHCVHVCITSNNYTRCPDAEATR